MSIKTRDDIRTLPDKKEALKEIRDIAREILGFIRDGVTPNFVDVARMCELVLDLMKDEHSNA